MESRTIRPTKKQRALLTFISQFIADHGYSPSYREIMAGLQYTSVATVSLHVQSLIARGHLRKRDYSARSLEIVHQAERTPAAADASVPPEAQWLIDKTERLFRRAEREAKAGSSQFLQEVAVMAEALHILQIEAAAQHFRERLAVLQKRSG